MLTMEESVFSGVCAVTIAMLCFGKHVSTIEAVFSVWSVPRLYSNSRGLSVQFKTELVLGAVTIQS
jgi:hypothetical protein